jgi:DeoR/GlpR family transcriptional regulator of sugar metabolism
MDLQRRRNNRRHRRRKHGEPQTPQAFAETARRTPAATVQQFVEWLNASPATVRRDIGWLAARNLLTRTRGGAENLPPDRRQLALPAKPSRTTSSAT